MARNPVINASIIASLAEFGDFEEDTGGELDGVTTDYFQAGKLYPRKIQGTHSYSDLVLTRAYDPGQDSRLIDWVTQVVSGFRPDRTRTCIKRVVNSLGIPISTIVYPVCRPRHIKVPNGKAGDSGISQIVLTLSVESVI